MRTRPSSESGRNHTGRHDDDTRTSTITVSYAPARPTVHVTGTVSPNTVEAVSETIRELLAAGVEELVVDFSHSDDGAALLPVLARARTVLAQRNGSLRLTGVASPDFLAALAGAPLEQAFLIYEAVCREI